MRKSIIIVSLAAGLLAICPSALLADDSTNSTPTPAPITTTKHKDKAEVDPAKKALQRRELMAMLGLTKADLKGLTPEDRKAKVKEAADKKIAELETKQAAGSLTEKEQSNLALLKKFELRGHAKPKTDS